MYRENTYKNTSNIHYQSVINSLYHISFDFKNNVTMYNILQNNLEII